MTKVSFTTKMKKLAQGKSDASGWNKHVNKSQKRIANKVVRRLLREEALRLPATHPVGDPVSHDR
jgi:hypothetical protein